MRKSPCVALVCRMIFKTPSSCNNCYIKCGKRKTSRSVLCKILWPDSGVFSVRLACALHCHFKCKQRLLKVQTEANWKEDLLALLAEIDSYNQEESY